MTKEIEHQIKPTSVTKTKGMNHTVTMPIIGGKMDRETAKRKKKAADSAAFLVPNLTAIVLMP